MNTRSYAGDIGPRQAWEMLERDPKAMLIDVRTPAEWAYVGVPDLSRIGKQPVFVPWQLFPSMQQNPQFIEHMQMTGVDPDAPLLFICRSGVRSRAAAIAMTERGYRACYNIASGFEGDPDVAKHRGTVNGWKVEGLPWMQG